MERGLVANRQGWAKGGMTRMATMAIASKNRVHPETIVWKLFEPGTLRSLANPEKTPLPHVQT